MAQSIRKQDSTKKHSNATRRHSRLCNQSPGCEKYAKAIEPKHEDLKQKSKSSEEKEIERENAHDDSVLADVDQDNLVKTIYQKGEQYDRENPGARIINKLFPDGKFTTITKINIKKQPVAMEQLALRIENLGPDHELYPLADLLRKQAAYSKGKLAVLKEAVNAEKMAKAEEEIAKEALRRQYQENYYDACKDLGKTLAERLFPKLYTRAMKEVEPEETNNAELP